MSWQVAAALSAVIGAAYIAIFWVILRGLVSTRQVTTNILGLATALRLPQGPELFANPERRRCEERLERELAEAQAVAHLGSWERDLATGVRTWSDDMYRILGLERARGAHAGSKHLLDLVVEDDLLHVELAIAEAEGGGPELDQVFRVRRESDGALRHLHVRGRLAFDADGVPERLCGTTRDVTDAHLAELATRAAEARFRITVDHATIGMDIGERRRFEGRLQYLADRDSPGSGATGSAY
jgi:PAS domain S-box-containing protein